MASTDIYLTREGHQKLKKEYDHLKNVRRRELSAEIEKARLHGDISENAEYDAAKESQGLNEKRVMELHDKLSRARIIEDAHFSTDEVLIGAKVKVEDIDSNEQIEYMLVAEAEADFAQDKISIGSPVGKALLGHKIDDIVEISIPAGVLKYKIMAISR